MFSTMKKPHIKLGTEPVLASTVTSPDITTFSTIPSTIPAKITFLDLSNNELGTKTSVELVQLFSAISLNVTTLDLSENNLGIKTGAELAVALSAIRPNVRTLDLRSNRLFAKTGAELALVFAAIGPNVSTLNLNWNRLGTKTSIELALAFAAIRPCVTILNLSDNILSLRTGAELVHVFAAIPPSIRTLNLSWNNLRSKNNIELAQAFAAIPSTVKKIELSIDDIKNRSTEDLIILGKALPHVMKVDVVDNFGKPVNHSSVEKLRTYIGSWIVNAHQILLAKPIPFSLNSMVLSYNTGFAKEEITSFVAARYGLFNTEGNCSPVIPTPAKAGGGISHHVAQCHVLEIPRCARDDVRGEQLLQKKNMEFLATRNKL